MRISILCIGRTEQDIEPVRDKCAQQTFSDYEFVSSTKEGIPQAWNDVIEQASGDVHVHIETDARPIRDDWLETIAMELDPFEDRVVNFGAIGARPGFTNANLALPGRIGNDVRYDESFPVCEDIERLARLERNGIQVEYNPISPVFHQPPSRSKRLRRQFLFGKHQAQIHREYGSVGPSDVEKPFPELADNSGGNPFLDYVLNQLSYIVGEGLFAAGFLRGHLQ